MTGYLTGANRGSERPEDEGLSSARGINSTGNNLYQDNYQKVQSNLQTSYISNGLRESIKKLHENVIFISLLQDKFYTLEKLVQKKLDISTEQATNQVKASESFGKLDKDLNLTLIGERR